MTIPTTLIASARLGIAGLGLTAQAFLPASPSASLPDVPQVDLVMTQTNLPVVDLESISHQTGELISSLPLSLDSDTPPKPASKPLNPSKRPAPPESPFEAFFSQYAAQFGLSADTLKKIAWCESHYHPDSLNKSGGYGGMFQFSVGTWQSTRVSMGVDPNPDLRFDAEQAILTAAYKIAAGGIRSWPVCSR